AIVTGAGSGIGRASARRFVAEGACVLFADLDGQRAQAACADLGARALHCAVDVRDETQVQAMAALALERFGAIDVLFNNAGVPEAVKPLERVRRAEWDQVIAVNLTAFFLCAQAVAPAMRQGGGGSIILTASIAARRPRAGMAAYVASKSGAIGLAKELALELAPLVRVNVINPGPAHTPMLREFGFAADEQEALAALGQALPLGRAIEPDDIANAAVYLASDESRMVTGVALNVDGGRDL
ncbi:MAG: SDR family NAD(P)-dependent oxidoreductase, partial [Solirubrobacteraceae bacterium]